MAEAVVFHGTAAESQDLVNAIARNCMCVFDTVGARTETCAAHVALLTSQRFVDGLLFEHRWWAMHEPNAARRVIRA